MFHGAIQKMKLACFLETQCYSCVRLLKVSHVVNIHWQVKLTSQRCMWRGWYRMESLRRILPSSHLTIYR